MKKLIGLLVIQFFFFVSCNKTVSENRNDTVVDNDVVDTVDVEDTDEVQDVVSDEDEMPDSDQKDEAVMVPGNVFGELVLNPSGNIPLSAGVEVNTKGVYKLIVAVSDIQEGNDPFVREFEMDGSDSRVMVPVLGLFPGVENTVILSAYDKDVVLGDEVEKKVTTEVLPYDFPTVAMTGFINSGWTMVNWLRTPRSRPEMNAIAVDEFGRIRWYTDFFNPVIFPVIIKNNSIYCGDGINVLYHYDLAGYELDRWDVAPLGYTEIHHDIVIKDDGNILIGVSKINDPWIEDRIIEIDPENSSLVREWDLKDIFPDVCDLYNDIPLTDPDEDPGETDDPVHNNSIFYDGSDNTLIVGSQRSGVAKITCDNELVWFFAPHITEFIDDLNQDGFSDSLVDGYSSSNLLSAVGDFKEDGYTDNRFPMGVIEDRSKYPEDFSYGEYLLDPLQFSGEQITDGDVLNGFENSDSFVWPSRTHSALLLKSGNMMVFDNGLGRNFSFPPISQTHYSRAVSFEIIPDAEDGKGGTVRQVWEHRIEESPLWYGMSPLVSNVSELDDGNILIVSGAIGTSVMTDLLKILYGDGPVGAMILEVDPTTGTELNRIVFSRYIDDNYPVNEFSVYRGYRFVLSASVRDL